MPITTHERGHRGKALRRALSGTALVTIVLGSVFAAAGAQAQTPEGSSFTFPSSGRIVDVKSYNSTTAGLGVDLVCPLLPEESGDIAGAAAFLTVPGQEIVPVVKDAESGLYPRVFGSYTFGTYDRVFTDPDGVVASSDVYIPFGVNDRWTDADLIGDTFQNRVKPNTTYSLGLVCTDMSARLIPDSDGTSVAVWGTFQTDASGNFTYTQPKSSSTVSLAAATSGAYSATLTASVPSDATGEVEFFEGETSVGKANVNAGKAALVLSQLAVGPHTYTATYLGDTKYDASARSAAATVTVDLVKVDTSVALKATAVGEDGADLTATVSAAGKAATASGGEVEFFQDGTSLGKSAPVTGAASFEVRDLAPGKAYEFTAKYSGDASYNASPTSSAVKVTTPVAPVELVAGQKAVPGVRYYVEVPADTFTAGDTVSGVVHSEPIALTETAVADTDGSAYFVFVMPEVLAKSTDTAHELVLTDESDASYTLAFVIDPAAAPGTSPSPSGSPATAASNTSAARAGGLPVTGGGIAVTTVLIGAAAIAAGAGILGTRRVLRRKNAA